MRSRRPACYDQSMPAASRTYGTDQGREIVRYLRTAYRAFAFDRLHVLDRPPTVTVTAPAAWLDSAEEFVDDH